MSRSWPFPNCFSPESGNNHNGIEKHLLASRRNNLIPLSLPRIGSLIHDQSGGMLDAVEHLIELGHRDVALVTVELDPAGTVPMPDVAL